MTRSDKYLLAAEINFDCIESRPGNNNSPGCYILRAAFKIGFDEKIEDYPKLFPEYFLFAPDRWWLMFDKCQSNYGWHITDRLTANIQEIRGWAMLFASEMCK